MWQGTLTGKFLGYVENKFCLLYTSPAWPNRRITCGLYRVYLRMLLNKIIRKINILVGIRTSIFTSAKIEPSKYNMIDGQYF